MEKVRHEADCLSISRIVFEKHQAVGTTVQQLAGFLERSGMLQLDSDQATIALQHIPNQKKVFLAITYQ
jgi:hypothetical protein